MEARGSEDTNRTRVRGRDVADVRDEAVARIERVEASHHAIPDDLRHDRRRGDRRASRVTVDERSMRRRGCAETEPVDETGVCRRMEISKNGSKRCQIRAVKARTIDLSSGNRANADLRRAADDRMKELLPLFVADLLGVVQSRQRPDLRTAECLVVEQHSGDHERPRERATTRLIRACDVANTEAAIVCEEPLAARTSHAARIDASSAGARGRAPFFPLSSASSRALRGGRRRRSSTRASRSSANGAETSARPRRRTTACAR